MANIFSLAGKVCVVTGGARGLGLEMLRGLLGAGATQAVILDLVASDAEIAAAVLAGEGVAEGGTLEMEGYACDVSNETSVNAAFEAIKNRFGRVDVLVTSAGICQNFAAEEYPTPNVQKLMDINVMGTWFCARAAFAIMPEGGSIITIGSMSASVSMRVNEEMGWWRGW
jgi:NAD(P)-dependent dehydrogenase (short-subunit alcohol dehydrogenase family)